MLFKDASQILFADSSTQGFFVTVRAGMATSTFFEENKQNFFNVYFEGIIGLPPIGTFLEVWEIFFYLY